MSNDIAKTSEIAGFVGACLVDSDTGLMLTSQGGGKFDLENAAALASEVMAAQRRSAAGFGQDDAVEEMLITLATQLHILRPLDQAPNVFLYVILDRTKSNLGMARLQVRQVAASLSL